VHVADAARDGWTSEVLTPSVPRSPMC